MRGLRSAALMSTPGAGSGTVSRVEQRGKRVTGMSQTPATAEIAAAVLTVIAITPPAFARGDTAAGGHVSGSNAGPSRQPSYSATRAANENISGVRRASSAGSARQLSSSGRREGWHSGSTPPGWTGQGEKRGWDGGKMPPRLSHRDRDPQWHDRNSIGMPRGAIASARCSTPASSNGREVGDLDYAPSLSDRNAAFWRHCL
jgi:hypothetical protein